MFPVSVDKRKQSRCVMFSHTGMTLLEVLMVMTLIAIFATSAIALSQHLFASTKSKHISNQLLTALYFTRMSAIERGETTSLCASEDGSHCSNNWSTGQLVFLDPKRQGYISSANQILRFFPILDHHVQITWRGFPNRSTIQFLPTGFTREQNGTFYYCPDQPDLTYSKRIILSKTGRVRIDQAESGDC